MNQQKQTECLNLVNVNFNYIKYIYMVLYMIYGINHEMK